MAAKGFYAVVLRDGRSDILTDWASAQAFIRTNPSAAAYKKHDTREDAEGYVRQILSSRGVNDDSHEDVTVGENGIIAYVDGSYNADKGTWGYAAVLFRPGCESDAHEISGSGDKYADSRNVTGEVYAAMSAVKYAVSQKYSEIVIAHDYAGIASWVNGAWKARSEMTQAYRDYMLRQSKKIDIKFKKVDGHTGVEFNERADRLAKAACGVL